MRGLLAGFVVAVCVLSGCGGGFAAYEKPEACGVPTGHVAAAIGSDEFETVTRGRPLGTWSFFDCHANLEDQDYALHALTSPVQPAERAEQRTAIAASDERFAVGRGQVGIDLSDDEFRGRWLCGRMRAYITGHIGEDATAADRKTLMTDYAKAVGCRLRG